MPSEKTPSQPDSNNSLLAEKFATATKQAFAAYPPEVPVGAVGDGTPQVLPGTPGSPVGNADCLAQTCRAILRTSDNWFNRRDYSRAVRAGCEPDWAKAVVGQGALTDDLLDLISTNLQTVLHKYNVPTTYAPEAALAGAVGAYVMGRLAVAQAIRDKVADLAKQPGKRDKSQALEGEAQ